MSVVTTVKDAEIYLTLPSFALDIETNTDSPDPSWKGGYGFSYVTDITHISLYAGTAIPTVVFDMSLANPEHFSIVKFLKSLFSRVGYTVIAHNATFDMRSILGHYKLRIPLGSYVWDTQTMALFLMMGEDFKEDTSLLSLATRYGLFKDEDEFLFTEKMKNLRGNLHTLDRGEVERYVALDSILAWRLYELQSKIIEETNNVDTDVIYTFEGEKEYPKVVKNGKLKPRFYNTKRWSNVDELVNWETRISRWCCNQAGRGVKIDIDGVHSHLDTIVQEAETGLKEIMDKFHNFFSESDLVSMAFLLFVKELAAIDKEYVSTKEIRRIYNRLRQYPYFAYNPKLLSDNTDYILSLFPDTDAPVIRELLQFYCGEYSDEEFVGSMSFRRAFAIGYHNYCKMLFSDDLPSDSKNYRVVITAKFMEAYFLADKEIPPIKLVKKKLFKPFYLFVVLKVNIPTTTEILNNPDLVTVTLKSLAMKRYEMDYSDYAAAHDAFSISKDALDYYFPNEDGENNKFNALKIVLGDAAKTNRIDEFLRHASRDGRLHTLIARKARTGRGTSSNMNLQNINMHEYRGYLVADDDNRTLGGVDLSNAENWMLALVFADNALAKACSSGDFHAEMTRIYWPTLVQELLDQGDKDAYSALRKKSKFVTFGSAYGAQADRISLMIGTTKQEAEILLANRDARFPDYARGRDRVIKLANKCAADGNMPPYTVLWSGRRIPIPHEVWKYTDKKTGTTAEKITLASRKVVNYLPQGGVGEIIWRAIVLIDERFEKENIDAYVSLQIHDEIVFDAPNEIFLDVAKIVSETLASIVPETFLNRTVPATRFISELGPENAKKWGYRIGVPYKIDTTKFVNPWGIFDMPEGEDKAPTWVGPLHEGYTVENEILEKTGGVPSDPVIDTAEIVGQIDERQVHIDSVKMVSNRWKVIEENLRQLATLLNMFSHNDSVATLLINGVSKGVFSFADRMAILDDLRKKGFKDGEYDSIVELVGKIIETSNAVSKVFAEVADDKNDSDR